MLRFLLRRPKTVRVPIENGPVEIQKVEIKQKSKYEPSMVVLSALH